MSDKQEPVRSDASLQPEPENGAGGKGPAGPVPVSDVAPLRADPEPEERGPAPREVWKTKPARLMTDNATRHVVTVGGVLIIACILAILFVIVAESLPLFYKPSARPLGTLPSGARSEALAVMVDEHRQYAFVFSLADGARFVSLTDGAPYETEVPFPPLDGAQVVSASPVRHGAFAVGLSDGRMVAANVRFSVSFDENTRRTTTPELSWAEPVQIDPEKRPLSRVLYVPLSEGAVGVGVADNRVIVATFTEREDFMGNVRREAETESLDLPVDGWVTALEADSRHENLYVGTSTGQVIRVSLFYGEETPEVAEEILGSGERGEAVTLLGLLVGDVTLIVGDAGGDVTSWQNVRAEGGWRLTQMHAFEGYDAPLTAFAPSARNKSFFTADAAGHLKLHYNTTGKTLLSFSIPMGSDPVTAVAYPEKGDGLLAISGSDAALHRWDIDNEHPETTWQSLFGELWYEGYEKPDYVWQSSSGTDDFEAKLSLTPLIVGTLKGTLYAMLFAVPIALMGALYASQFMHPSLKGYLKPSVEIMAGLPSVVLGFLAGLWLAPLMERVAPGVFLSVMVFPLFIFLALLLWHRLPLEFRARVRAGTELIVLIPVVVLAVAASIALGGWLEAGLLGGDFRAWLLETAGVTYDQRNSLVVGIAMGFAVIPIIFTIAEDSLSNVPPHLRAGSLALGATRWQTAINVVLPTASPGIFSAVMIGLGRAVGETMIVLMATGNTPVMDWSVFSGFRALSANIAVELPEAPYGSTHYRVLFLAALLLFIMTFVVNTAAEMIRLRLRKKYQAYA